MKRRANRKLDPMAPLERRLDGPTAYLPRTVRVRVVMHGSEAAALAKFLPLLSGPSIRRLLQIRGNPARLSEETLLIALQQLEQGLLAKGYGDE